MRIGIDITPAIYDTGVGFYTRNLVNALAKQPDLDLVLYGASLRGFPKLHEFAKRIARPARIFHYPPKVTHLMFHKLNLPIEWLVGDIDVFHAWDWYIPRTKKAALVTTVHDLAMFKFPHIAHPEIKKHHSTVLKRIKDLDATVIAVSETTKRDLTELFAVNPQRVQVIPEALPEEAGVEVSEIDVKNVLQKYSIAKHYFLSVGTKEPRKNYPKMIEAWEKFQKNYNYVIVGKKGWQHLPEKDGLINLESVSHADLAALYRGADILLYASLYEGFGLPILEAFYHRLPVVTSRTSSMPEVAGEAAILVDPESVADIEKGISLALQNNESLIDEGLQRLQQYSWEDTANQTVKVYKKAYER